LKANKNRGLKSILFLPGQGAAESWQLCCVQLDLSAAPHLEVEMEGILNLQSQQKIQPAEVKNQSKFQHQKKHCLQLINTAEDN
jgi:hypothetical protein